MSQEITIHEETEFATIDNAALDHVTGGGWAGDAWNWVKTNVGGLFGGGEGGSNINVQAGNNNRTAQGNSGNVSLGDNSPVTPPR